jgi:N-acetyl-gamma-glutamyl-phosphate/LysW-gamma-L-alpha-aminoadipyl-6-phosphate reductase
MSVRVAILGGSGYLGGELLRLLLFHPAVGRVQVSSRRWAGEMVHRLHPNLRGVSGLRFCRPQDLEPCDVLFVALPHGEAAREIERLAGLAERMIDCSADFRLRDPAAYRRWYRWEHPAPAWLGRFVYGLPERHRAAIAAARYVSGVGCNATVVNLALGPLADAGWLERAVGEVKVGSSEAGAAHNPGSHHPERSGAVRVYSPSGHRHLAEVHQELGEFPLHLSMTAIEMVRGVHLTAHCFLRPEAPLRAVCEVWALYRQAYAQEPFVRLVAQRRGLYRFPEPKILAGSNYCDIGFAMGDEPGSLVVFAALDNLMKGGAGTAVQAMNLMLGLDERSGLGFPGLHPL